MPDGEYIGISEMRFGYGELACYLWVVFVGACKSYKLPSRFVINHQHDIWAHARSLDNRRSHTHTQSPFKICLLDSLYPPYHIHHDKLVQVNFLQSSIENDNIWPMTREKIKWGGFTVFLLKVWCFYISLWEHVSPEAQITWQQQTILTVEAKKRARSRATSVSNLTVKKGSKRG